MKKNVKNLLTSAMILTMAAAIPPSSAFAAAVPRSSCFADKNNDGVCDNQTGRNTKKGRSRGKGQTVSFTDTRSDSICHNQASGEGRKSHRGRNR